MTVANSPRSINVMWEEVELIDQNGIITLYEVLYQPLETFGGEIGALTTNVSELATNLTNIEEFVNYTSVGAGPYSDGMTVITPQDGKS